MKKKTTTAPVLSSAARERLVKAAICFIFLQVLMHIIHGVSYVNSAAAAMKMATPMLNYENAQWGDKNTWLIYSPFFTMLVVAFKISGEQTFYLTVYAVVQLFNFVICLLIGRLSLSYALVFVSAGWSVTVGWWMGYPDMIIIACLLALYPLMTVKKIHPKKDGIPLVLLMAVLTFNHSGIALFVVIILALLANDRKTAAGFLLSGYAAGLLLINGYLAHIGYVGYSRTDILFAGFLTKGVASMNAQPMWAIYSAFYGVLIYFAVFAYQQPMSKLAPVGAAAVVALAAAALAADTSRLLSIFAVPIIVHILEHAQKNPFANPHINKGMLIAALLLPLIIGEYHIWEGNIYNTPPHKFSVVRVVLEVGGDLLGVAVDPRP